MCEEIEHGDEKSIVLLAHRQQEDFDPRGEKRRFHHDYGSSKTGGPTDGVEDGEERGVVVERGHDGWRVVHGGEVEEGLEVVLGDNGPALLVVGANAVYGWGEEEREGVPEKRRACVKATRMEVKKGFSCLQSFVLMAQSRSHVFLPSSDAPSSGSIGEASLAGLPSRRIIARRFMSSTTTENLFLAAKASSRSQSRFTTVLSWSEDWKRSVGEGDGGGYGCG